MVVIDGKLIDPRQIELSEAVPPGQESIQVRFVAREEHGRQDLGLLTGNPAFDFLRDEPDLYD